MQGGARGGLKAGSKAPVQPEDGATLGIHRLKRVADHGPPLVGTLPPPRKRGGGRGGYRGIGDRNGLPPKVGSSSGPRPKGPPKPPRGGGGGRGGRGGPMSPKNEKSARKKERKRERERVAREKERAERGERGEEEMWNGANRISSGAGPSKNSDYGRRDRPWERKDTSRSSSRGSWHRREDVRQSWETDDVKQSWDRDDVRQQTFNSDDIRPTWDRIDEKSYKSVLPFQPTPSPPSSSSHLQVESSPQYRNRYSPSHPVATFSESETGSDPVEVPRQGALQLSVTTPDKPESVPRQPVADAGPSSRPLSGPSRPSSGPSNGRPIGVSDSPPEPQGPTEAAPRPPKFKPRNHNVRENAPLPPPEPVKEPSPPPPPPPKFKPRNHNPRKNDPVPKKKDPVLKKADAARKNDPVPPRAQLPPTQPLPRPSSPTQRNRTITSPVQALVPQQPAHEPLVAGPSSRLDRTSSVMSSSPPVPMSSKLHSTPPTRPVAVPSTPDEPEDIKPDPGALNRDDIYLPSSPPPQPRSPQKEGVMWLKPEEIPAKCWDLPGTKRDRNKLRLAYVQALRAEMSKHGRVVTATKWRDDGLGLDWVLRPSRARYVPSDDDDDDIEILPTPRQKTPEAIVLEDTPSPPPTAGPSAPVAAAPATQPPAPVAPTFTHVPTPAPLPASDVPVAAPAPVAVTVSPTAPHAEPPAPLQIAPEALAQPGATTLEYPAQYGHDQTSDAFKSWVSSQLEQLAESATIVSHFTTPVGLRVRWIPNPGAKRNHMSSPAANPPNGPVSLPASATTVPVAAPPVSGPQDHSKRARESTKSLSPRKTMRMDDGASAQRSVSLEASAARRAIAKPEPRATISLDDLKEAARNLSPVKVATPLEAAGPHAPAGTEQIATQGPGGLPLHTGLGFPSALPAPGVPFSAAPQVPSNDLLTSQPAPAPAQWLDAAALEQAVKYAMSTPEPTNALAFAPLGSPLRPAEPHIASPLAPSAAISPFGLVPADKPIPSPTLPLHPPPQSGAERVASLQAQMTTMFDNIDRWTRLQASFPARAEMFQRQIARTEQTIFEMQNELDAAMLMAAAERPA